MHRLVILAAVCTAGIGLGAAQRGADRPIPGRGAPGAPPVVGGQGQPPARPRPPASGPARARLFAPQDLGLIEGPDRDEWQKPDQIMDALGIADGSLVGDLGAGGGWFTARLSARVGPNGRVYAEDIQQPMLDAIARRAERENLRNVTAILGTPTDPRLPAGIDAVLIVAAYREMQIPPGDPIMLLRHAADALKPNGRIGVVDFNPGGGGPGPAADQRVSPNTIVDDAVAAGLRLMAHEPQVNQFQYLLVFGSDQPARKQ